MFSKIYLKDEDTRWSPDLVYKYFCSTQKLHLIITQEQLIGMSITNKFAGSETVTQIIRHRAK